MSTDKTRRPLRRGEVVLRDHQYDGIQEYDQRLPNWWLHTLYWSIIFSIVYWFVLFQADDGNAQLRDLESQIEAIQAARMAALDAYDDDILWEMSRNTLVLETARRHYQTHCQACHMPSLRGNQEPGGIGESLVDGNWKYGGQPTEIMEVILRGSPDRSSGMQAWESQLGATGAAGLTAYILSHHPMP